MYQVIYTARMKKDLRRVRKRGKDISKLVTVLDLLKTGEPLPETYHDHQLEGNLRNFRECHIESNWLLLYRIDEGELILVATATGTHSDIFGE
ncbi:MAG: type II toxin-antitoxin system YafQ family toxin [Selenomonadaceae bacterium]|nr:type II toxin-antitoxin system YafQ family toxin [Selenomonadaceae bacterium]